MISKHNRALLFIEPVHNVSKTPVIDTATRRMVAALQKAKRGTWDSKSEPTRFDTRGGWKGEHVCICGAMSSSYDYFLENGMVTNSLCVHYLAYHRRDVPQSEIDKVMQLPDEEIEPSPEHLTEMRFIKKAVHTR